MDGLPWPCKLLIIATRCACNWTAKRENDVIGQIKSRNHACQSSYLQVFEQLCTDADV